MLAVSYIIIFAFHLDDRVNIERSFGHLREQLTSLNYLTREQLEFKDSKTLLQLRNCALAVVERKNKIAISAELKFTADCLLKWFNKKFKPNNLELSNKQKRKDERHHSINSKQDCCCLFLFCLKLIQQILMRMKKQCLTLTLSFVKNTNF